MKLDPPVRLPAVICAAGGGLDAGAWQTIGNDGTQSQRLRRRRGQPLPLLCSFGCNLANHGKLWDSKARGLRYESELSDSATAAQLPDSLRPRKSLQRKEGFL